MKIGPLFKWFGSKWQAAKHYPSPGQFIVEPFAGGAGYSLNYCDRSVCLWDTDPNIAALWKWLICEAKEGDVRNIPLIPPGVDIRKLGLSNGQALLVKHWQRTNNVGDCWTVSPWGNKPGQWTANTRARVAEEIHAIKHWCFIDPIPWLVDAPGLTWFIDPPYQYNYRYSPKLLPLRHDLLGELVRLIPITSTVIACEAIGKKGEVPNYLPFASSHESVTSRRKADQSHHSKELVYVRMGHGL
jgi:hypothetical protein